MFYLQDIRNNKNKAQSQAQKHWELTAFMVLSSSSSVRSKADDAPLLFLKVDLRLYV